MTQGWEEGSHPINWCIALFHFACLSSPVMLNTALICTKHDNGEALINTVDMDTGHAGGTFQSGNMYEICVWGSRFLAYPMDLMRTRCSWGMCGAMNCCQPTEKSSNCCVWIQFDA